MGGILQLVLREIEVECLPTNIPDTIEIDAGHIEIGGSMHVSDITLPEGVRLVTDPSELILSVNAPAGEEEKHEIAEAAKEPELVKAKGKAAVEEK